VIHRLGRDIVPSGPGKPEGVLSVTDDNPNDRIKSLFFNGINDGLKIRAAARDKHT
jgi:hypothetical protein